MTDAPDADGWIKWSGGECPVHKGTRTDVRFRNGYVRNDDTPEDWNWEQLGGGWDISAYRVRP